MDRKSSCQESPYINSAISTEKPYLNLRTRSAQSGLLFFVFSQRVSSLLQEHGFQLKYKLINPEAEKNSS